MIRTTSISFDEIFGDNLISPLIKYLFTNGMTNKKETHCVGHEEIILIFRYKSEVEIRLRLKSGEIH